MKKGKIILYMECEKCGDPAPLDEEKSNENWSVYKNEPCHCGGKFKLIQK